MKASINTPCHADWNSMKIEMKSRFCESCSKHVVDFTKMSREKILAYLLENKDKQTCGRIYKSQLDFSNTDYLVTIKSLSKKSKNNNLSFYLLTMSALILSGCTEDQNKPIKNPKSPIELIETVAPITEANLIPQQDSIGKTGDTIKTDSIVPVEIISMGEMLLGDIDIGGYHYPEDTIEQQRIIEPDENTYLKDHIYKFAEKMPEFVGGVDSLMNYLHANIEYPKKEKKLGITGTLYVQMTIDKEGNVLNPKILRSIAGSENFDQAVLSVINEMPNWIPGEHEGKAVSVYFNIPVRFSVQEK